MIRKKLFADKMVKNFQWNKEPYNKLPGSGSHNRALSRKQIIARAAASLLVNLGSFPDDAQFSLVQYNRPQPTSNCNRVNELILEKELF